MEQEILPMELNTKLLAGNFTDADIEEIEGKYELHETVLNSIGLGYLNKSNHNVAEKYFLA